MIDVPGGTAAQYDDQTQGAKPAQGVEQKQQQEMQTAADVDAAAPASDDPVDAVPACVDSTEVGSTGKTDDEPQQKTLVGYGPSASSSRPRDRRGLHRAEVLAAPAMRGFAKEQGVDLETVQPSHEDGVISRDDVSQAFEVSVASSAASSSVGSPLGSASVAAPAPASGQASSSQQAPSALDAAKAAQRTPPELPAAPSAGSSAVAGPSSYGLSDERVPIKGACAR